MNSSPPGTRNQSHSSGPRRWIPSSRSSHAADKLWNRLSLAALCRVPGKGRNDWSSYLLDTTLVGDVALQPGGFLSLKPCPGYFAGHPVTLIQLSETEPDLLVYRVPALVKKRLLVVEQLNGSFHKLFDASVSTARHVL